MRYENKLKSRLLNRQDIIINEIWCFFINSQLIATHLSSLYYLSLAKNLLNSFDVVGIESQCDDCFNLNLIFWNFTVILLHILYLSLTSYSQKCFCLIVSKQILLSKLV